MILILPRKQDMFYTELNRTRYNNEKLTIIKRRGKDKYSTCLSVKD
jgi:hypothetical protein